MASQTKYLQSGARAHHDVVDERLVGPRVVKGRGHVHVAVDQDEQRPLEAAHRHHRVTGSRRHRRHRRRRFCPAARLPELPGGHVVSREQAVPGVAQVFPQLLVQLLRDAADMWVTRTARTKPRFALVRQAQPVVRK